MAAPGKSSASRWGSFLSSAVSGVENRLDNMLAEAEGADSDEQAQPKPKQQQQPQPQAPMSAGAAKPSPAGAAKASTAANSRSSSNNRANDRLQARLAKAMAGKGSQGGGADMKISPRSSFDSRTSTDRPSIDATNGEKKGDEPADKDTTDPSTSDTVGGTARASTAEEAVTASEKPPPSEGQTPDTEPTRVPISEPAAPEPHPQPEAAEGEQTDAQDPTPKPAIPQADLSNLAKDMEEIKARQQEEIQEYVERLDSLQSKLQYLSKSAAESAKKTASGAAPGSIERKLAERDEKIALLMEEGGKLSNTEQKFRATIKRLRQQIAENEKQAEELKKGKDKALSDAEALRNRLDGSEEKEKVQEEARKATVALQREIDSLKKERAAKDESMHKLEKDLKTKTEKAEAASSEAHNKALAAERERQRELEDTVETLKAEKESLTDKARLEGLEWSEKLERATERNRNMETEMKTELKAMESKLEAMRSVAEEASSGSGGDAQAQVKLIRQIETLQSQYATASDNWQGIEASLLTKVSNLEKERDEAQRRESEMRKKARDATSRSRQLEDELQELQPELATTKQELESCREQLANLRTSSKATETALEQARADLEKQQRAAAREFQEPERRQWRDETPGPSSRNQSRPDSPLLSVSRTFSSEFGFQPPGRSSRRTPVGSIPDSTAEGPRRMSSRPPGRSDALSPVGSGPPPTPFSPFDPPAEPSNMASPSLAARDDPVEEVAPSSPRNVAQDMISVSTVGAGPSVQLVERMSAAIRRLEGEKVAAKEEMTRVCGQRDEARSDIVGLMKELESAKSAATKVSQLEKDLADINSRYQTTLEMLGEKSELVEELRADVQDVKAMYRELVERTVK